MAILDKLKEKASGKADSANNIEEAISMMDLGGGGSGGSDPGEPATSMSIHICSASEYDANTRVPAIAAPDAQTFYLVPAEDGASTDLFVEWIYTNSAWEKFGSATIALKHIKDDPSGNGGIIEGFIEFPKDVPYDPAANTASGENAHAEGGGYHYDEIEDIFDSFKTTASGQASHAEGGGTTASGQFSHAEGEGTTSSEYASHAEGGGTDASGYESHAEGYQSTASGTYSHAEGKRSTASGHNAHAEGTETIASAHSSHAEGFYSSSTGDYSHAEGYQTEAKGESSHAEGFCTIASSKCQHVQGQLNVEDANNTYAEIVGNGRDINHRSNARTLDWNGNEKLSGGLTLGMGTNDETSLSASELKALKALLT